MRISLEEQYNIFLNTHGIEEFIEYYNNHTAINTQNYYNLSRCLFYYIVRQNSLLSKSSLNTANTRKNKSVEHEKELINRVSKEDFIQYYIELNKSQKDTCEHFNITYKDCKYLIDLYNCKKDKEIVYKSVKTTKLERYGNVNYNNREKSKQTCLEKYGVDNLFKDKDFIKQSYIESLGVEHPMQLSSVSHKMVEHTDYIKRGEKIKQTCIEKYGVDNVSKAEEIKDKIRKNTYNTFMDKYNVPHYFALQTATMPHDSIFSKPNNAFAQILDESNIFYTREYHIEGYSYDFKVKQNLIEINPFATHNINWSPFGENKIKSKTYHFEKSKLARQKGFRCIHVFDWDDTNKIIQLLKDRPRVFARKCKVGEIQDKDLVKRFINNNHLQGYTNCSIAIGLFHKNDLVSVLTFGKPRYNKKCQYELVRYCSSYNVVGGIEKLFTYFIKNYNPDSIVSYCDFSKFVGNTYEKLGFIMKSVVPSRHWYNPKLKMHITDNLLRQRGFDQLVGNIFGFYGKGTSNDELMREHGFVEIYDAGQATYIWNKEK